MILRIRLEALIDEMLDGKIMLDEAKEEFEKLYIQKALARNNHRVSKTATVLGIHRNTLSKRVAEYKVQEKTVSSKSKHSTKSSNSKRSTKILIRR
jgi:DNA-binding NtrC family response regulator